MKLLEKHIQQTCCDWLELDGWRIVDTDPRRARGLGVSEKGIADKQCIRYLHRRSQFPQSQFVGRANAEVLWIEFKRIKGTKATKLSQDQNAWHAAERARGARTVRAGVDFGASIEGFQAWYRKSGLMRRKI